MAEMTDDEMTESYNLAAAIETAAGGNSSNEVTPDESPPAAVSIEADQCPAEEDNVKSPEEAQQPMQRSVPESLRGSLEYGRPEQLPQPVPQVQPLSEIQVAQHTRWQRHLAHHVFPAMLSHDFVPRPVEQVLK